MAKLTKSKAKRMIEAIDAKSSKLFLQGYLDTRDYIAIDKIMKKTWKRITK